MRKLLILLTIVNLPATALAQAPLPGAAPIRFPPARSVPLDLAREAVAAAEAACLPSRIGVTLIDAAGLPKLFNVPDGISGLHGQIGFRKANTALLIKAPSEQITARSEADKALAAKVAATPDNYMNRAGGLPILVGDEMIGAIGVSGAEPSEKAAECAIAGIKAIQARLK